MKSVLAHISGIGWVTATGVGRAGNYEVFDLADGPLPHVDRERPFEKPNPSFRRMDEYSKIGFSAISLALEDSGLDKWREKRNIGIIVSTEYGCLRTDLDFFETVMREEGIGASPALFAYTLPNSFLGEAAIRFGLTGKAFVVNEHAPLGLTGLNLALDSIALGECDQILYGISNLKYPPPFDNTCLAPPGALFFVIEKSPRLRAPHYGRLRLGRYGGITFEGEKLQNLSGLIRECLKSPKGRPALPANR